MENLSKAPAALPKMFEMMQMLSHVYNFCLCKYSSVFRFQHCNRVVIQAVLGRLGLVKWVWAEHVYII